MIKMCLLSSTGLNLQPAVLLTKSFKLLVMSLTIWCVIIVLMTDRKKLSRRLLFDRSANEEHEKLLLSKLKQQSGGKFTSKMEGMVR